MALPTAPLGQLPSMNMPYSIPRYEQPASIWEKALASFLVNAAGGAASQGVENVMARDYAGDFGEKPATGFSKLLGPKVGAQDARIRKGQQFQQSMQKSEFEAAQKLAAEKQQHDYDMERLRNLNAGVERQDEFVNKNDLSYLDQLNENERLRRQIEGNLNLATTRQNLDDNSPRTQAEIAELNARAAKSNADAAVTTSFNTPQVSSGVNPVGTGQAGPSPEDIAAARALAERNKAGAAAPQEALSFEQQIQKWLSEGKSPEDIKLLLSNMTTARNKVQDQQLLKEANAATQAQQQQQTIQEIMRAAGFTARPQTRRDLSSIF